MSSDTHTSPDGTSAPDLLLRIAELEAEAKRERKERKELEEMVKSLLIGIQNEREKETGSLALNQVQSPQDDTAPTATTSRKTSKEILASESASRAKPSCSGPATMDETSKTCFTSFSEELIETAPEASVPRPIQQDKSPRDPEELMHLVDDKPSAEECKTEEEDEWHTPFGESTYTLLYISKANSQGFWYGIFVYALQMSTILLTLINILVPLDLDNPLRLPPMVEPAVTAAQGVTLFLGLAFQSDLIEAFMKLRDGFYPEILEAHPGATFPTWLISCLAQLFSGFSLLTTFFIVTLQVDNVLSMMLNFGALHFMAAIDDLAFAIAKLGFVTHKLQAEVKKAVVQVPKRKRSKVYGRILFYLVLVGLFIGYGILKRRQLNGEYLPGPTHIYVQFGDAYNAKMPYYSGLMTSIRTGGYRKYHDVTKAMLLGYCYGEKAWTFTMSGDPCKEYLAISQKTEAYDVTTIPDSEWLVLDRFNRSQPFDSFSMASRDCQDSKTCQGTCLADGLCHCPHNRFGMDCEFSDVCPTLTVDERLGQFPSIQVPWGSGFKTFGFSLEYQILEDTSTKEFVKVYDMPVYYSNKTWPAEILFFAGRRWILTSEWEMFNWTEARSQNPDRRFFPEKTIAAFENNFHGYHEANYTPFFISDPVDFETPDFQPTPVGLGWFIVKEDNGDAGRYVPDIPVDTVFTCSRPPPPPQTCIGKPEGFCGWSGQCNQETGFCECSIELHGAVFGDRCELERPCYEASCFGRGECDGSSGFCRCTLPYHGKLCLQNYMCYEEYGRCKNGGICNMATGACDCPDPATSGAACEKRANCLNFGCANGGICGYNGNCICHPPFYGAHCDLVNKTQEELFCSKNEDCRNGSCDIENGICACEDPANFGTLCQLQFNCSEVVDVFNFSATPVVPVCLNDGICNATTGLCDCPEPYFGPDCSQVPPCLSNDDCGDPTGIWNKCDIDTGFCNCYYGNKVQGKMCEKSAYCSSDDHCLQNGFCRRGFCTECDLPGHGGNFCESLVAGMYSPRYDDFQEELEELMEQCGFEDLACCSMENPPFPDFCNF